MTANWKEIREKHIKTQLKNEKLKSDNAQIRKKQIYEQKQEKIKSGLNKWEVFRGKR